MAKVARDAVHLPSYYDMLEEIERINPDAAWWIEEAAKRGLVERMGYLTHLFSFARSPQGSGFWGNICNQIDRGWDRGGEHEWEYDDEE